MTQTLSRSTSRPGASLIAGLIAVIALASILFQVWLDAARPQTPGILAAIISMSQYFTILTNLLVAAVLGAVALDRPPRAGIVAGTVLSIVMVGVIYHALLAPEVPFQGAHFWTDLGFHTITPLATLGWWLIWGDKDIRLAQVPYWLIWPAGYCLYALIRGALTGHYPYFFFDIGRFGPIVVAEYIVGLVIAFALAGVLIWLAARALSGKTTTARI